jgi:2'-5' RNA ligase
MTRVGGVQGGHLSGVPSTSALAATAADLRDHWVWRPEWTPDRPCLYWYLTFSGDELAGAVDDTVWRAMRRTSWLDPVPPRWCHVTIADVAFVDELRTADLDRTAAAVSDAVRGEDPLTLSLGPPRSFASAVVLAAGPLDRLRSLKTRVRQATSAALGPRHTDVHRHLFWPHVSLGYVNRAVSSATTSALLATLPPVDVRVDVGTLTLAAVTRRERHYQWQVEAQVDLAGS